MFPQFTVHLDALGHPCTHVPSNYLWDLVEYLSYQRVHADYHFEEGDFHITFPTLEPAAAQHILDQWMHAKFENHALV